MSTIQPSTNTSTFTHKSYEPKQESKHIIYSNVNNVHGYTTSKFLPTSGFK